MADRPEILIYMSDQHSACTQRNTDDKIVSTPFLDELSERAYVFDNAYTSCPLCVPARASFMTARLPSGNDVYNNADDFKSSEITFPHLLGANGYRSTLIGRMHLVGEDQLHGFDRHVGKDITAPYWGTPGSGRKDWGEFVKGFAAKTTLSVTGSGDSPVQEFDRHVMQWTEDTLRNCNEEEPQLFVVGTYGPHFPYVGDKALMEKYLAAEPESVDPAAPVHPGVAFTQEVADPRKKAIARAAYRALVETQDKHIETVYNEFRAYLERRNRKGVFIYVSDHGDMCGKRDLYGKKTFYEPSCHIPLYMDIIGEKGHHIRSSVSLMDIGPSLADMTGSPAYPFAEGKSFMNLLKKEDEERYALSEFFDTHEKDFHGHMVHQNGYKLITYSTFDGDDELYHSSEDPEEVRNLVDDEKERAEEMKKILEPFMAKAETDLPTYRTNKLKTPILNRYGKTRKYKNTPSTDMLSFENVSPDPVV